MSLEMQVCCDVCSRVKRDINHWWILQPSRYSGSGDQAKWLRVAAMPWNDEDASGPMAQHLCGQACMLKAMERFMQCHESVREQPIHNAISRTVPYPDDVPDGFDYSPAYQN